MTNKNLLIIFTRNPELGKVKSRLAKDVGNETALAIYKDLLKHTHDIAINVKADRYLFYSESIQQNDMWTKDKFTKLLQKGDDLGLKMLNAFKEGFNAGYENIAIIGSDILELTSDQINHAFNALKSTNVVIGPAVDGGYYLLGLSKLIEPLFKNKAWGTETVLKSTVSNLAEMNQSYKLLSELNDIDYVSDIKDSHMILKYNLASYNQEKTC